MLPTLRSVLTTRRALSLVANVLALGASALVFNGAAALPPLIDLGVTAADLTIYGDDAGDQLSFSSASGDINGDTIDDLILGANLAGGGARSEAGKTYVIYGDASFPAVIDLNATSADLTILGEDVFDQSGYSVASGDIDGDTIDDLIVSAPIAIGGRGRIYIIYGGPTVPAVIDLSTGSADVTVTGASSSGLLGFGLAASDLNGDTTDDLIAGALTIPGSISGYPAVSVPAGCSANGLPVGLQAYARRHDDARLLDLALVMERVRPWPLVAPAAPT